MTLLFGCLVFPMGLGLVLWAFRKSSAEEPWYDIKRPKALVWGIALIAIALDAAIFGILPVWGK